MDLSSLPSSSLLLFVIRLLGFLCLTKRVLPSLAISIKPTYCVVGVMCT